VKILFVHQTLGQFGGAETNIQLVAELLGRRGCDLDLLYDRGTGRNEAVWQKLFGGTFRIPDAHPDRFVRELLGNGGYDLIYLHNLGDLEAIEALVESNLPVVRMVHDHSLYCMRSYKYNYLTRKICTRPASGYCVVPCLASIGRRPGAGFPLRWVSYRRKRKEIELSKRCRQLVVYSEYQKNELVRNGFEPANIEICAPIVGVTQVALPAVSGERNLLLYVGQIIRGKGVDRLLSALARIRTDFECVILGDGNHRPACERLCRELGLDKRVTFGGYWPPSELESYYRESSVFVMSSLWPEPFGMAGPEAMRHGIPVVAFDAGGIREWLIDGENGYLVPWNDVERFASRVEELLRDKPRARQLGRRAQERIRRYDAEGQVEILWRLFERIVHRDSSGTPPRDAPQENAVCL